MAWDPTACATRPATRGTDWALKLNGCIRTALTFTAITATSMRTLDRLAEFRAPLVLVSLDPPVDPMRRACPAG